MSLWGEIQSTQNAKIKSTETNLIMKLTSLFVAATLLLGETVVFAGHEVVRRTHVHYMQLVQNKESQVVDPFDSLRTPVGPTDTYYGNEPRW